MQGKGFKSFLMVKKSMSYFVDFKIINEKLLVEAND